MESLEPFFGIAPEPFDPADIDLSVGKALAVVDPLMTEPIRHPPS